MSDSLISVIVPVYKTEKYLDECVTSIVNQTYRNLEIILVDDGSPDNCPQMCDAWASKDPRIKVIHKANGGAASARNMGIDAAQGQYIGFVDSDDCIRNDMYEVLVLALQNSQKKIASCFMIQNTKQLFSPCGALPEMKEVNVEETLDGIFRFRVGTSLCRRLFERSVFDHIRLLEGEINEEFPVLIPMTVAAGGMVHVRGRYYFYRATEGSVTSTYWEKDAGIVLKNLEYMYAQLQEYDLNCKESFFVFAIRNIYSVAVVLDIHFAQLDKTAKDNLKRYIGLLREYYWKSMTRKVFSIKEKLMYTMIMLRILRPVYKLVKGV